jgi:hypothetical protein
MGLVMLMIGAVGFLFGGFYGSAVAIVGAFVIGGIILIIQES